MLVKLGIRTILKSSFEILASRLRPPEKIDTFERHAVYKYGRTLAERFLLNYSEKMWGLPCNQLSPGHAEHRIKGLNLRTFLKEAVLGRSAKTEHLDGKFLYPTQGIGMIADCLAEACGHDNIKTQTEITRIVHAGDRVQGVEVNGDTFIETDEVVSTLPLPLLIRLLDPEAPAHLRTLARGVRYRNLILVTLILDKPSVTSAGTLYFPDRNLPFTRVVEPRNRSRAMSPPGKTSLVAELPCSDGDDLWMLEDDALVALVRSHFAELGLVQPAEILDATVRKFGHAYPVSDLETVPVIQQLSDYAGTFSNLTLFGRNAEFRYSSIHDMLMGGKEVAESVTRKRSPEPSLPLAR